MGFNEFDKFETFPGDQQYTHNEIVTVGVSSVKVAEPVKRRVLYLRNSSTGGQIITISLGGVPAVANQGIILNPGEYYIEATDNGFDAYSGSVMAISSAVTGKITIMER